MEGWMEGGWMDVRVDGGLQLSKAVLCYNSSSLPKTVVKCCPTQFEHHILSFLLLERNEGCRIVVQTGECRDEYHSDMAA